MLGDKLANVQIRRMRADDAEPVAALCGELGYPSSPEEVAARLEPILPREDQCLLVAEQEGEVVGWIHVRHDFAVEADPWAEVAGLVVTEKVRSRGVGRALLDAGERWARENGHKQARLRSNVIRTRAHEFYKRAGYEIAKSQLNFRKNL